MTSKKSSNNVTKTPTNVNIRDKFRVETGIGPMTDNILNTILDRITTDNFRGKLTDKIIQPITGMINEKIKPYLYISLLLYSFIVILLFVIILLVMMRRSA